MTNDPRSEALEPCPFCGEEKQLETVSDGVTEWIVCRKCGCAGPVTRGAKHRVSAWNTRTPSPPAGDEVVDLIARTILAVGIGGGSTFTMDEREEMAQEWARAIAAALSTLSSGSAPASEGEQDALIVGLKERIAGVIEFSGYGLWRTCSGCYESEDGYPNGDSPHSDLLGGILGGGCRECGGIGARFDDTDYDAMARDMLREDATPTDTSTTPHPIARADLDYCGVVRPVDPDEGGKVGNISSPRATITPAGHIADAGKKVGTAEEVEPGAWRSMLSAPRDGTLIELVVDYRSGGSPLLDADLACTIGFNNLDNDYIDEWRFVGWCCTHDHFVDGDGKPVAWRPSRLNAYDDGLGLLPAPPTVSLTKESNS